eukprot:scaffold4659_cov352-Prasinococcus_capsulatus_cf.AAC.10
MVCGTYMGRLHTFDLTSGMATENHANAGATLTHALRVIRGRLGCGHRGGALRGGGAGRHR